MNERFSEAGLAPICREVDPLALQTVIKLMRDQNLYEKSKDFTLCHELSHASRHQARTMSDSIKDAIPCVGVIGGILLLFLAVSIIPFVQITVTLVVGGIAVTIAILATLIGNKIVTQAAIEEEKLADMDASKALQDATGGIYLFETYRHQNLAAQRSNPTLNIDANGNNLRDKNHPPLTERIAYLKAWQSQHVRA